MISSLKEGWKEASRLHTGTLERVKLAFAWAAMNDHDKQEVKAHTDKLLEDHPEFKIFQEINNHRSKLFNLRVQSAKKSVTIFGLKSKIALIKTVNFLTGTGPK